MARRTVAAAVVTMVGFLAGGCGDGGDTTNDGFFQLVLTEERLEVVDTNKCAVRGNATNGGNLRVLAELGYEALAVNGAVLGESTASFEVAPFSNFQFRNSVLNQSGQPSSTVFTNDVACSAIASFRRVKTQASKA